MEKNKKIYDSNSSYLMQLVLHTDRVYWEMETYLEVKFFYLCLLIKYKLVGCIKDTGYKEKLL